MRRRALIWGSISAVLVRVTEERLDADAGQRRALMLATPGVPAYEEAESALAEKLAASGFEIVRTDPENVGRVAELAASAAVVVAIGVGSLRQAVRHTDKPIVAAMCLRSQLDSVAGEARPRRPLAAVALDLPFAAVAREVRRLFPEVRRIGVLRRRGQGGSPQALASAATEAGLSLHLAECRGPADLVETFLSMRSGADLVWCPADELLFSATTVKPLILASLKTRLGVVGFSAGLVRAGAVAGILPDFRAIGERAAQLALAALREGASGPTEPCPAYRVALNRRVLRILGLKHLAIREGGDIEVVN